MAKRIEDLEFEYDTMSGSVPVEHKRRVAVAKREGYGYGHDLQAAVNAGYRRKSREHLSEAMEYERCAAYGGTSERAILGLTLSRLIEAAALRGVSPEDARWALEHLAARSDATSVEATVRRATDEMAAGNGENA